MRLDHRTVAHNLYTLHCRRKLAELLHTLQSLRSFPIRPPRVIACSDGDALESLALVEKDLDSTSKLGDLDLCPALAVDGEPRDVGLAVDDEAADEVVEASNAVQDEVVASVEELDRLGVHFFADASDLEEFQGPCVSLRNI